MITDRPPNNPHSASKDPFETPAKIAVIGLGQMGLLCAGLMHERFHSLESKGGGPEVVAWGHREEECEATRASRGSHRLESLNLPEGVRVTGTDQDAIGGADMIISAVPVQHTRETWKRLGRFVKPGAGVVSVSKGIENGTLLRPTQVIHEHVRGGAACVGVLSGPTIASELVRHLPAVMIAASDDPWLSLRTQWMFASGWLRVYTNADVPGVELAGATKNVIAIAAGVVDGLGLGANAKSALLARGLAEISRLGVAMGASLDTFFGIAGVGDLATTCFSPEGRNRSCGEALGRGEKLQEYLSRSRSIVEGVATCKSVVELSRKVGVEMPITAAVHAILFEGARPSDAIVGLMSREQKAERLA